MARSRRGRGEGSIHQRKDGSWCVTLSLGHRADGRRRRKSLYGKTKAEVVKKLQKLQGDVASGRPIDKDNLTILAYIDYWLENTVKSSVAPNTYTSYRSVYDNQIEPFIGNLKVATVSATEIEAFYGELARREFSARTIQKAGFVIGRAMRQAVKNGLAMNNPVRDIPKPRSQKAEMQTWDSAETKAFLKASEGDRLSAMYYVALSGGLRQGELFALEWRDISFDAGCVTVQRSLEEISGVHRIKEPKSGKGRKVDLPAFVMKRLNQHRAKMLADGFATSPVFCDHRGGYLYKGNVTRRSFGNIIKAAKVRKIRFHDMRHTHATLLLSAGEHIKVVSERLGHASVQITLDTYTHVLPTMQKAAAEKMQKLLG